VQPLFRPPNDDEYSTLDGKWQSLTALVAEEYGVELTQSEDQLDLLQKLVDDDVLDLGEYG
jgi:hypothetical protein